MPTEQTPAVRDDYGVLTPMRLRNWIGALTGLSAAVATLLGFVGAQHGVSIDHFSWSLAAVSGTAIGTVLLAGFTGALAWTTSGDVRATIRLADATVEDQRARDRPIIVARLVEVNHVMLDPAGRATVPALHVWMKNVGAWSCNRLAGVAGVEREDDADARSDFGRRGGRRERAAALARRS